MVKESPERCPNIFEKFEVVKQNSVLLIIDIHEIEKMNNRMLDYKMKVRDN